MKRRNLFHTSYCAIILLMFASTHAFAMSSTNYSSTGNISSGGSSRASLNYMIQPDVLGQIGNGKSSSASYSLEGGSLFAFADTLPPVTTASPAGAYYTSTQNVALSCNDFGGSGCSDIHYTTDGSEPTIISPVYATAINIPATTTLKYFATDNDGNIESVKQSIYYFEDAVSPTGTISINSGAGLTNSTNVTLFLTCLDTISGCSEMKFSNDNASWGSAVTNAPSDNWTITTGEGIKTVYVQFKDVVGNWSASYSDTITLAPFRITGKIVNRLGLPVPYAPVKAHMSGGPTSVAVADSNGDFVLDHILSGQYRITTRLLGYRFIPLYITISGADAIVEINTKMSLWDEKYSSKYLTDQSAPGTPAGVTATAISSSIIELSWTVPQDNISVSGFRIFNGDGSAHIATAVTSYHRATGLTSGVEHCFRVSAFDGVGNESAQSTQVCATTQLQ